MKRYFVYELIDPQTQQPFYIGAGSGRSHKKRLADHILEAWSDKSKWSNQEKCQRIINILLRGDTVTQAVHECVDETHCATREKELIKHYGRMIDGGILTNVHPGGGGIKGVRHGANKNGRLKPKTVYQFDLEGKLLKCFPAVTQAAAEMDVSHTAILNCCAGRHNTKSVAGYQWSYCHKPLPPLEKSIRTVKNVYEQYDMDGNYIATYPSGVAVKKTTGVDPSTLYKYLAGKINHAGGFKWKCTSKELE